jgi:hypothetical protein
MCTKIKNWEIKSSFAYLYKTSNFIQIGDVDENERIILKLL